MDETVVLRTVDGFEAHFDEEGRLCIKPDWTYTELRVPARHGPVEVIERFGPVPSQIPVMGLISMEGIDPLGWEPKVIHQVDHQVYGRSEVEAMMPFITRALLTECWREALLSDVGRALEDGTAKLEPGIVCGKVMEISVVPQTPFRPTYDIDVVDMTPEQIDRFKQRWDEMKASGDLGEKLLFNPFFNPSPGENADESGPVIPTPDQP